MHKFRAATGPAARCRVVPHDMRPRGGRAGALRVSGHADRVAKIGYSQTPPNEGFGLAGAPFEAPGEGGGDAVISANNARASRTRKRTRIQVENEERILDARARSLLHLRLSRRHRRPDRHPRRHDQAEPPLLLPPQDRHLPRRSQPDARDVAEAAGGAEGRRRPGNRDHRLHRAQARDEPRPPEGIAPVRHGSHPGGADPLRCAGRSG